LHSLALDSSGHGWAWGSNSSGQLGNGTTTNSSTPVPVIMPAGVTFTAIAGGGQDTGRGHSLALDSTGHAWAWGWNALGQLGNGTTTDSSTPVAVSMPSGVIFTRIAAGQAHSLALAGAGPPANVTLSPASAVNNVGTSHTVTATVNDANGNPVQGVAVFFNVQGADNVSGSCTTDSNGQCSFTYAGPNLPGADVITGCADSNGNGSVDAGEPCGEATKAWMAPTSTPGQTTGGGQIANTAGAGKIAFGFTAKSDQNGVKGECTVVDPAGPSNTRIKCLDATALVQTATHATFFGNATVNGTATTYRIDVDDFAEPGAGSDTFKIQTASGYVASGILTAGNVQVHH
jgi:Bacterial Ig-like domain (group 1)/Regulator of chromosome condensation (RCC1) repeat